MMTAVYIIGGVVLIFFLLAMMGPREYSVSRSITIKRSAKDIYDFVKFLKNQNEWGPWIKKDPHVQLSYTGSDGEVGFVSAWKGNKEVGQGQQEITRLIENERVESALRFIKPFKSESNAFVQLVENSDVETNVSWGFNGDNKAAIARVFGLFMNMDKAVGKDFEAGLSNLKEILER